MSVIVVATITPLREHRAEVITAFEELIARVHANDEGCELYALHENDEHLVMVEKWTSAELLDAHEQGPSIAPLFPTLAGKLKRDPELLKLAPHPAGTAEQGVL